MLALASKASELLEEGKEVDQGFFEDAAAFFKEFADRCHHAKEERLLFERMVARGIPRETGPIAVMLREHDEGRAHVKRIAALAKTNLTGPLRAEMVVRLRSYAELLAQHIEKEDLVLYPLAERVLTEDDNRELMEEFERAEDDTVGPGMHEKYHGLVDRWEKAFAG